MAVLASAPERGGWSPVRIFLSTTGRGSCEEGLTPDLPARTPAIDLDYDIEENNKRMIGTYILSSIPTSFNSRL